MPARKPTVSDPAFWETMYAAGREPWELGGPAPPLVSFLERQALPHGRVAVLGCGRGHDVRLFARHGYETWGFDFSAAAIEAARRLTGPRDGAAQFEHLDIFDLPAQYPTFFDGVWEYTCFCAIDPPRRAEYVELVRRILKPSGWLLALFFPLWNGSGGPPFPVSKAEVRRLLEPHFSFEGAWVPTDSAKGRQGAEWLVLMRAKS
jgi:SAM-dependent methyltransferase